METMRPEEVVGRDGFRLLSGMLGHVSGLGLEEKVMMIHLGAVRRIVAAMLNINPSVTQVRVIDSAISNPNPNPNFNPNTKFNFISDHNPKIEASELYHCTDLVSTLVRASVIPSSDTREASRTAALHNASPGRFLSTPHTLIRSSDLLSPFSLPELTSLSSETKHLLRPSLTLAPEDLQAVLNREFLDDSLNISTSLTALALQHICWSRGEQESSHILAFLARKISECTMVVTGVDLSYRPYFRTVSELLLSNAGEVSSTYDAVLSSLISKADNISRY
jgi:hypothetical protein